MFILLNNMGSPVVPHLTVTKEEKKLELKTGYCLSCLQHCDFAVVEVCDAKNPKTEICKGTCPLLKQKPILGENGKPILDENGEKKLGELEVCGKRVRSIRSKHLTVEQLAEIDEKAHTAAEERKEKKVKEKKIKQDEKKMKKEQKKELSKKKKKEKKETKEKTKKRQFKKAKKRMINVFV